jgi:Ni,Fe-hydrogenase III large subunit
VQVGGSALELDGAAVSAVADGLEAVRGEARRAWRELQFNASFQDRLPDVGVLRPEDVARLGAVGPAARAAGVADDARTGAATLAYGEFAPALPGRPAGDVQARFEQRAVELWQSFDILAALLDRPLRPTAAVPGGAGRAIGIGRVESPRGATLCVVERSGDRLERVRLRTGSYANWPAVAFAAADNLLPDFPLINKSFELCYACADR